MYFHVFRLSCTNANNGAILLTNFFRSQTEWKKPIRNLKESSHK